MESSHESEKDMFEDPPPVETSSSQVDTNMVCQNDSDDDFDEHDNIPEEKKLREHSHSEICTTTNYHHYSYQIHNNGSSVLFNYNFFCEDR